jgi:hypothetical protein
VRIGVADTGHKQRFRGEDMRVCQRVSPLCLIGCTLGALMPSIVCALGPTDSATSTPATAALAERLSQEAIHPVIVLMKNRLSGDAALNDQAPLVKELAETHAPRVKSFRLVNAIATSVSDSELTRLKANAAVAAVIPDVAIHKPRTSVSGKSGGGAPPTSLPLHVIPGACGTNGAVLLDPEALGTTNTDSTSPQAQTARSLGITGAGVKVAYVADGIDPQNINFLRANGRSAFIDYQDFSGDGVNNPTGGGEAFIDANAIAGQGLHVYNVSGFSAEPDPSACNVRIEGVAPGASLVGLDAFGGADEVANSTILAALEYAVLVDHVDVINESFGGNPLPDTASTDLTRQFNEAAVAAGVTIVESTGDAGENTDTIDSSSTDPAVIAVGASTTFRTYAQTNLGAARYFATTGWLDDNISSLSSGGFEQSARTLDLVAPGDFAWGSCDATPNFFDCTNFLGAPSNLNFSGGTSLSSPLTAGAAALVIEAYRISHHGASPSPALIKQILTSTATDLGLPAVEQGAGLLNSYKAVLLAESINNGHPLSAPAGGQGLLLSQDQLNAVGAPGSSASWSVTVTNPGASGQNVQVWGRTFGQNQNVQSGGVFLSDSKSPQFEDSFGLQDDYATFSFFVPPGADRLTAAIASPDTAYMSLVDPLGRFAAYSLPQGFGNFDLMDVRAPTPGKWTGIIYDVTAAEGANPGPSSWQVATQSMVPFATVSPNAFYLAPGQSQTLHISAQIPGNPGDVSGAIVLSSSGGGTDAIIGAERNSIPVTLRGLIDPTHGGNFSGTLTGGNGRAGPGQVAYYQFNIAPGHSNLTANVSLSTDASDLVGSYLIAPDGSAVGFGQNSLPNGSSGLSLTAYALDPPAGTWTLIIDLAEPVVGDVVSQKFTGNIQLDNVRVSASGLPNSRQVRLGSGMPVTVPVTITNTGAAPGAYFIDPRLNTSALLTLASYTPPASSSGYALPLGSTSDTAIPEWIVPPQTSSIHVIAAATVPVMFDYGPYSGDPDLLATSVGGNTAIGSYAPTDGIVTPGLWNATPTELGPFPNPESGFVNLAMNVTTAQFDASISSDTGDFWYGSIDPSSYASFAPLIINPGQTAVINVTIVPAGSSGTVVSGNLYVDMLTPSVPPGPMVAGDQLAAIPYSYTIR